MRYFDVLLVILYLIALIVIIVEFSGLWALASVLLLVLIISSLQKSYFEDVIKRVRKEKDDILNRISEKLDVFSNGIDIVRKEMEENSSYVETRLNVLQDNYSNDMEKTYRDMTRKVIDIENKLNSIKRTLAAAYGAIDERMVRIEGILNLKNENKDNDL